MQLGKRWWIPGERFIQMVTSALVTSALVPRNLSEALQCPNAASADPRHTGLQEEPSPALLSPWSSTPPAHESPKCPHTGPLALRENRQKGITRGGSEVEQKEPVPQS